MPGSPPPLPRDAGLPVADTLLSVDTAVPFLRAALAGVGTVDRVRLRYLAYAPGQRLTVQYQLLGPDGARDAAVTADRRGAAAHWYPHDPALPALADPAGALRALGLPGDDAVRLAWVPGVRAALRAGDVVLKLYGDRAEAAAAVAAMAAVGDAVPTAGLVAADVARGLVAQRLVSGRPLELDDAVPWGGAAGALVTRLQAAVDPTGLARFGAVDALAQADAPVALAAFARPDLAARLDALRRTLAERRPADGALVAAHGDYNVGQLLEQGGGLHVVDLDTLAAAAPAFDPAAYATNLVSGRADDETHADAARRAVLAGYGAVPADLDWYVAVTLLRRVDRAVRRLKRDWPERTTALVAAAERAVRALPDG